MKLLLADENVLVPILVGLMKAYSCDSETMKHMLEIPSVFSHPPWTPTTSHVNEATYQIGRCSVGGEIDYHTIFLKNMRKRHFRASVDMLPISGGNSNLAERTAVVFGAVL